MWMDKDLITLNLEQKSPFRQPNKKPAFRFSFQSQRSLWSSQWCHPSPSAQPCHQEVEAPHGWEPGQRREACMELAESLEGTAPGWAACSKGWSLVENYPVDQTEAVDIPEKQLLNSKHQKTNTMCS